MAGGFFFGVCGFDVVHFTCAGVTDGLSIDDPVCPPVDDRRGFVRAFHCANGSDEGSPARKMITDFYCLNLYKSGIMFLTIEMHLSFWRDQEKEDSEDGSF